MIKLKNYDGWGNELEIETEVIRHPAYRQFLIHQRGWDRNRVMEIGKVAYFKNRIVAVQWPDGDVEEYDPTCIWKKDRS